MICARTSSSPGRSGGAGGSGGAPSSATTLRLGGHVAQADAPLAGREHRDRRRRCRGSAASRRPARGCEWTTGPAPALLPFSQTTRSFITRLPSVCARDELGAEEVEERQQEEQRSRRRPASRPRASTRGSRRCRETFAMTTSRMPMSATSMTAATILRPSTSPMRGTLSALAFRRSAGDTLQGQTKQPRRLALRGKSGHHRARWSGTRPGETRGKVPQKYTADGASARATRTGKGEKVR